MQLIWYLVLPALELANDEKISELIIIRILEKPSFLLILYNTIFSIIICGRKIRLL